MRKQLLPIFILALLLMAFLSCTSTQLSDFYRNVEDNLLQVIHQHR